MDRRSTARNNRTTQARHVDKAPAGTRSIVRTCEMLNLIGTSTNGLTVTEVGEAMGMPKSSAHRYLTVLEIQRFVERDPQSTRYRLGLGMLALQSHQTELLVQRARPYMEAIRDRFNETVNLGVLSRSRVVYLEILESTKGVRHSVTKGEEDFIHSTALGKAIASTLSEREVLELLARTGMERRTAKTVTDPVMFLRELEAVRTRGYAIDDGENEEEARCIAVLIPQPGVPAAISVSGVAARFPLSLLPKVAQSLKEAVAHISGQPAHEFSPPGKISKSSPATGDRSSKTKSRGRRKRV